MTVALLLHRADGASPSTSFRKAAFGPADPFARDREIAWEGPGAMSAGRVSFTGEVDVAHFPHTETIVVVEGELSLIAGRRRAAGVGAAAKAPSSPAARHFASRPQRAACSCSVPPRPSWPNQPGITPLRADANFKPSNSLPAEILLGPAPQCRSDNVFKDELTGVVAGTWDSTPYHRIVRAHRLNEFMYLLDGSVRFAAPDGSVLSAVTGDALFVPQGAPIGWESSDRVAKFYVCQSVPA